MSSEKREAGLRIRREVLGDEYVDRALEKTTEFTEEFQTLISEYCWGGIWTRDGLPRQTRSLLNLAIMTAMNRPNELRIHARGALRNGCTPEEIREVLLQTAVYCGIPAALDSFNIVRDVLAEQDPGE